jgi:hypothetical protein
MTPFGSLKNISVTFLPHSVNISSVIQRVPIKLILTPEEDKQLTSGNYILGISATDGVVTRTIFMNLLIK